MCSSDLNDPLLNRVSQFYNEYRTGLLSSTPDWRYVPKITPSAEFAKVAEAVNVANSVTELLLQLAYW